ncbi:hypothetical protein ACOSP7_011383 [Xanthoceras sorbifolium]|uniref:Uncharacterized protein n=1 Tax=Xanthoceras sorbifolium TaxID=99658 RepID=A0ABQ8HRL5_9ROSI|nr:hypothetical protein JRO89_XS07G0001700 [Xanthoceras sorbifolium]
MGICLSSDKCECQPSTAKVITLKGDLHEYNVPVFVSQVLQAESVTSSSSSSDCFLCNADSLLYDDFIPSLGLYHELYPDQIYFLLPTSKLQYRLSASDMAALAVKASVALQTAAKKGSMRRKNARISPVLPVEKCRISLENQTKTFAKKPVSGPNNIGMTRSGSVRRLHKYTSRRAKLAVRSFRLRLSTIYEGIVV